MLLAALSNRIVHSLHSPIPEIPPYSDCSLFYILPPSRFTDRLGRPIAVLTIREVRRDGNGKLDDLGQWIWWASELCRRTSRDYWVRGRWNGDRFHGRGGEGCVVIIDAGGAGYRNMVRSPVSAYAADRRQEVELLPTLGAVGPKNFPGMVDTAYIVNAGWTQRRLWQVLQKILPRSTMEKIRLLDTPAQVGEFFDLDRLPKGACDLNQ